MKDFAGTRAHDAMQRTVLFLLLFLAAAAFVPAQSTSSVLKGVVTDEAKAIITGAKLTLTSERGDVRARGALRR